MPTPVFETVMVKEAVSPGWMTELVPLPVTVLVIVRCGSVSLKGVLLRSALGAATVKVAVCTLGSRV